MHPRSARGSVNSVAFLLDDMREAVSNILERPFTQRVDHQAFKPDQRILAMWAADCAEHVLPYFEGKYPNDDRPRKAIEALRAWISTGDFSMPVIRRASLSAHAVAKGRRIDADAAFAAHAAGQAVATTHVATHALGSSIYGIRAAAAHSGDADDGLIKERGWQLERLREYAKRSGGSRARTARQQKEARYRSGNANRRGTHQHSHTALPRDKQAIFL
jgi:hypothetical protein